MNATARALGLDVEDPLVLDDPDAHPWDDEADLVVVGLGGAGVSAAIEGLERGLSVIAVDRYEGGGSTTANGGIFYAGGGTVIQKEAGEDDTPQAMYDYLKIEAGEVVADETLRRFVDESIETVDWLLKHGGKLNSRVWREKASYPPSDYFLYHPDNSLLASYAARAKPAARGHRAHAPDGTMAIGIGKYIHDPMQASAIRLGLDFRRYAEARQLVVDRAGRVIGVKILGIPEGSSAARRFGGFFKKAGRYLGLLPPAMPLAAVPIAIGRRYLRKAAEIEIRSREVHWIRARGGVLLSAGGFVMNPRMLAHFAPGYVKGMATGTLGDQGAGIVMGMSAGGATDRMGKISGWRFINPPKAWAKSIIVNARGERFVNEMAYGAVLGEQIGDHQGGVAWLVYDAQARREASAESKNRMLVPFQRQVTALNLMFNARRAPTLEALAAKLGLDRDVFLSTVDAYNRAAAHAATDPWGKEAKDMMPVATGPFYAMDVSVASRFLPLPVLTMGGLRVDERTGEVLNAHAAPIRGLYAAGRTAVGICSQTYVSGLSYADCVFSGRRVARHVAAGRPAAG